MATKNFVLSRNADPKYLTADNKRELLGSIGAVSVAESTPTSMFNRTERLAITNGVVGATWVTQVDQPGIAWKLIAADATLDASWQGFPYTTNPDGSIAVTMELADSSNIVPDIGALYQYANQPTIGDGYTINGVGIALDERKIPDEYFYSEFIALATTASPLLIGKSWDGTTENGVAYSLNGADPVYVASAGDLTGLIIGQKYSYLAWPATSDTSGSVGQLQGVFGRSSDNSLFTDIVIPLVLTTHYPVASQFNFNGGGFINGRLHLELTRCEYIKLNQAEGLKFIRCPVHSEFIAMDLLSDSVTVVDVSGWTTAIYFDAEGCTALRQIIAHGFTGVNGVNGEIFEVADASISTDALGTMLSQMAINPDGVGTKRVLNLSRNPCDAQNGATPEIVAGAEYTQASIAALLVAKYYSLQLADGTLNP